MTKQIDSTVFHNASVRVPSLKAGESYLMKTWGKKACSYKEVTFLNWQRDGVAQDSKVPQLNRIRDNEHLVFVAADEMFVGVQRDMCLVREDTKQRITFAALGVSVEQAPVQQEETLEEMIEWLHANAPAQIGVQMFAEEHTVDEDKTARKRRLDAERKRAQRAAARAAKEGAAEGAQGQDDADVPDVQAAFAATLVGVLSESERRSAWA